MIPVRLADEPARFDVEVRQPGLVAVRELAGDPLVPRRRGPRRQRLPELWTRALPDMRRLYRRTCAYLGLYVHRGTGRDTVDHFVPKTADRRLAYEWSNLRYASADVNRLKGTRDFVDPFHVEEGWFGLDLVTFRVRVCHDVSPGDEPRWAHTLKVLNEPTFCDARQWYHERYFGRQLDSLDPNEPMPYETLCVEAPFVARELRRQRRLRPEDQG